MYIYTRWAELSTKNSARHYLCVFLFFAQYNTKWKVLRVNIPNDRSTTHILLLGNMSPKMVPSATWLWNLVTFPEFVVFSSVAFGFRASCQTQDLRSLRWHSRVRVKGLPQKLGWKPRHELQNQGLRLNSKVRGSGLNRELVLKEKVRCCIPCLGFLDSLQYLAQGLAYYKAGLEQCATEYRFTRPDLRVRVLIIVLEIEFEV